MKWIERRNTIKLSTKVIPICRLFRQHKKWCRNSDVTPIKQIKTNLKIIEIIFHIHYTIFLQTKKMTSLLIHVQTTLCYGYQCLCCCWPFCSRRPWRCTFHTNAWHSWSVCSSKRSTDHDQDIYYKYLILTYSYYFVFPFHTYTCIYFSIIYIELCCTV